MDDHSRTWHRVSPEDVPDEGRVRSVVVDGRSIAMTRCGGRLGALENHCPHQGGPLGEGSIEKGLLRCPWHGYDYDPATGAPPGVLAEHLDDRVPAYDVEEDAEGVRVRLPNQVAPARTVADVLVEYPGCSWRRHRVRDGRPLQPRVRGRAAASRGAW
jgi:pyruvate oxidase